MFVWKSRNPGFVIQLSVHMTRKMRPEAVLISAFPHSVGNKSQHLYAKTTW